MTRTDRESTLIYKMCFLIPGDCNCVHIVTYLWHVQHKYTHIKIHTLYEIIYMNIDKLYDMFI